MSAPGRWLRLDVTWEESAWLDALPGEAAGCWPRVLCVVKRDGVMGRCKAPSTEVLARKWRVSERAITALLDAAAQDGALKILDGEWVVTNWAVYQEVDRTRNERQRKHREHNAVTPRDTGVTRRATETLTETKETSTTKRAVRGKVVKWQTCPADWIGPNDIHRTYADLHHVDVQFQEGQFRRHFFEKPKISADDTFLTWLENAVAWGKNRSNGNGHSPKGAPRTAADGRTLL